MFFNKFKLLVIVTSALGLAAISCAQKPQTVSPPANSSNGTNNSNNPTIHVLAGVYEADLVQDTDANYPNTLIIPSVKFISPTLVSGCNAYVKMDGITPRGFPTSTSTSTLSGEIDVDNTKTYIGSMGGSNKGSTFMLYYNSTNDTFTLNSDSSEIYRSVTDASHLQQLTKCGCR